MYIIPALHPAFLFRQNMRFSGLVELAFQRACALAKGQKPKPWTESEFVLPGPGFSADTVVDVLASMRGREVAFDVETDGRHPLQCTLRCIAFYDGRKGITVPLLYRSGEREEVQVATKTGRLRTESRAVWKPYFSGKALERVAVAIKKCLLGASQLITQNGQYDRMVVKSQLGVVCPPGFDTMLAHHIVSPWMPHDLGFLAALYTNAPYYKATDAGESWASESDEALWRYNLRDAKVTWLCAQTLREELKELPQNAVVMEHDTWQEYECQRWCEVGLELDTYALAYFQQHYRTIAKKALEAMRAIVAKRLESSSTANELLDALLDKLKEKADEEQTDEGGDVAEFFNPASLQQLRLLLGGLGIPLKERTETGDLSTAKEFLVGARKELLAMSVDPSDDRIAFLDYLFAWREATKVDSTYLHPEVLKDGRVHPSFFVHVTPTGRLSSAGPNCFSGDTELLTPTGWIRIDSWVKTPTVVAQWHPEDGALSWTAPLDVIQKESSDWVHIYNEHIDLMVTADHRCPLFTRQGELKVVPAAAYPEDHRQVNAVNGIRGDCSGLPLSDDELRFIIATQADGSYSGAGLDFSLTKPRKVERMRWLLQRLKLDYSERTRKPDKRTGSVATRFYVREAALVTLAKRLLGPNKMFGPWLGGMSSTQREVFMDEVMRWDGCATRMNRYASMHRENASWVQTVFILSGRRANLREYHPKPNAWGSKAVSYQVDVSPRIDSWTTNRVLERSSEVAPAYCLSVPSTFVIVRRNGKVMVSGQCQNQPAEIRGMFVARQQHVLVSMDWDALEMRLGAFNSEDPAYIEAFRAYDSKTGPKPHVVNMSVIFNVPATQETAEKYPHLYRAAKVFAYAGAYGASDATMYEKMQEEMPDLKFETFKKLVANYKKRYAKLFAFQEAVVQQGTKEGYIDSSILKRRMYFFEAPIGSKSPEASAMQNAPYQSGGADVVGLANRRIMEKLVIPWRKKLLKRGEKWTDEEGNTHVCAVDEVLEQLAQVHDELLFEVPKRLAKDFVAKLRRIAEQPPPGKPHWHLPVEVKVSRRWKPVQARCKKCRETVNVEMTQPHVWEGACPKGHQTKIEVQP